MIKFVNNTVSKCIYFRQKTLRKQRSSSSLNDLNTLINVTFTDANVSVRCYTHCHKRSFLVLHSMSQTYVSSVTLSLTNVVLYCYTLPLYLSTFPETRTGNEEASTELPRSAPNTGGVGSRPDCQASELPGPARQAAWEPPGNSIRRNYGRYASSCNAHRRFDVF